MSIQILSLSAIRDFIDPELVQLVFSTTIPLRPTEIKFDITGISTQCLNAFRRCLLDERPGVALTFDIKDFNIHDRYYPQMLPEFVRTMINLIPIRADIGYEQIKDQRFSVSVSNSSPSIMRVFSGDIIRANTGTTGRANETTGRANGTNKITGTDEALFNPTVKIAELSPGYKLQIDNIYPITGLGREHAMFQSVIRAYMKHTDLERYTDDELRSRDGVALDLADYKKSCLLTNPTSHQFGCTVKATSEQYREECIELLASTCMILISRLRAIDLSLANSITLPGYVKWMFVFNETDTLGSAITREVHNIQPDISHISYTRSGNSVTITAIHTESPVKIIQKAISKLISNFTEMYDEFKRWD